MKSDDLRNLRVGPVIAAGRMNDATIRGMKFEHGLKLGDRDSREIGNPRYDLADCARVFLLHILIKKLRMSSQPAVWAVNKAYSYIFMIAEGELAAIDSGGVPKCPRYEMRLSAMGLDVEYDPEIRLYSSPEAVAERNSTRGRYGDIVIDLREIVRGARDQLAATLGHSVLTELRHDFMDAPDV